MCSLVITEYMWAIFLGCILTLVLWCVCLINISLKPRTRAPISFCNPKVDDPVFSFSLCYSRLLPNRTVLMKKSRYNNAVYTFCTDFYRTNTDFFSFYFSRLLRVAVNPERHASSLPNTSHRLSQK